MAIDLNDASTCIPAGTVAVVLQLVFFRGGSDSREECVASDWISDPTRFAQIGPPFRQAHHGLQMRDAFAHLPDRR
jgi:hypothetical protein